MDISLERKDIAKYHFLFNALEDGWTIKKRDSKYIFTKRHSHEKEIYNERYLDIFIEKYMNLEKKNREV